MLKDQNIICISTSDWVRPWGSKQQLMLRLSACNKILYIEYQASFLHLFSLQILLSRLRGWIRNLRRINDNLVLFMPYPCIPFGNYFRIINKFNQCIMAFFLKRVLKKLDLTAPGILWVYTPSAADLLGMLNKKSVLFHCIADFSSEKKNSKRKNVVSAMENEIAKKSDIVLALTCGLYNKYKRINSCSYLFPSAVDYELFYSIFHRSHATTITDITVLSQPKIGMVGYLDGRVLDIKLLSYIADTHQQWTLVLIGPKFRNVKELVSLSKRGNVYFLGEKKHEEIPEYIKNLDVCIIPYVINEFTNNVSALKLYEYLAMGKPVVATNLDDLQIYKEVVKIAYSKEDFVRNIKLSLQENDAGVVNKRLEIAKNNSWESRLRTVTELFGQYQKSIY